MLQIKSKKYIKYNYLKGFLKRTYYKIRQSFFKKTFHINFFYSNRLRWLRYFKIFQKHFLKNFQDSSLQVFPQTPCCLNEANLMRSYHQPQVFGSMNYIFLFTLPPVLRSRLSSTNVHRTQLLKRSLQLTNKQSSGGLWETKTLPVYTSIHEHMKMF